MKNTVRTAWNIICPVCLDDDALDVTAHVSVRLTPHGTDPDASGNGDHEWTHTSPLSCASCGWAGIVKDASEAHIANPEKERQRPSYSAMELEASLCAWEHMNERRDDALYGPYFENMGSAAMRACAPQAGRIADAVYRKVEEEGYAFEGAFDFEFVPAVLDCLDWQALVEDNQFNGAPYRPKIFTLMLEVMRANPAAFTRLDRKAEWMTKAKAECVKQWQYPDLLSDHQESTDAAYEAGQDPATFVRLLGEKYDLTPVSVWNA